MENNTNLQPDLESIEREAKRQKVILTEKMFHMGTPQHGNKNRGVGITRKSKEETKKAKKLAKSRRAVNQARKNKKFRASGSKQRK